MRKRYGITGECLQMTTNTNQVRAVRIVETMNIRGEPVRLTIVGAIVTNVQPARQAPTLPSRREWERSQRACVDCPVIA